MPWPIVDPERDNEIFAEIEAASDRAAAILAATVLEDRLTEAIQARLANDPDVVGRLFKGMGPLASFGAKTNLAYLMGVINKDAKKTFDVIRDIRNTFAHQAETRSFDAQHVKDKCNNNLYTDVVLIYMQHNMEDTCDKMGRSDAKKLFGLMFDQLLSFPKTPRTVYMNTIKLTLLHFAFVSTAAKVEQMD